MLSLLRHLRVVVFIGVAAMVGGAAIRPADAGQLYAMGESPESPFFGGPQFGIVNPAGGSFTRVGSGTFANGYYAMTFDPLTNSFYTTNDPIGSGFASQVKQIDATTGAITIHQINDSPTSSVLIGGLGFDSLTGQLYAMGESPESPFFGGPQFGIVNPANGSFTRVGSGTFANGYYAMTFDPLTNSFYTTNDPTGSGFASQVKQINATTGAITIHQINDSPNSSVLIGGLGIATGPAAPVPEPPTLALFGVGLAGLGLVLLTRRA